MLTAGSELAALGQLATGCSNLETGGVTGGVTEIDAMD